jgi:hypothetical protein
LSDISWSIFSNELTFWSYGSTSEFSVGKSYGGDKCGLKHQNNLNKRKNELPYKLNLSLDMFFTHNKEKYNKNHEKNKFS